MRTKNLAGTALIALLAGATLFTTACSGDQGIDDGDKSDDGTGDDGTGDDGGSGDDGGDDGGSGSDEDAGGTIEDAMPLDSYDTWSWPDPIYEDEISEAGDRDFFALEADEGIAYLISTAHYVWEEAADPDTVLRLYNQDGDLLATNDDMPHRYWETDSALYFQATYTGTYYLEVLEWTDWAEDPDYPADGGNGWYYELLGFAFSPLSTEAEPNDTKEEADAIYDDAEQNAGFFASFHSSDNVGSSYVGAADYATEFYGMFDEDGDTDIWRLDVSGGESGLWFTINMWPDMPATTDFVWSLYDEDWNLLAKTEDPEFRPGGDVLYNHGIAYPVPAGVSDGEGGYISNPTYLVIESADGTGGNGTFYQGQIVFYTQSIAEEDGDNDLRNFADQLDATESTTTTGYFYGRGRGEMSSSDSVDYWYIDSDDVGGFDGKYLSVAIQASEIGSQLDAKVVVYDEDGTELASASFDPEDGAVLDGELRDLLLEVDYNRVYVGIEAESVDESESLANFYAFGYSIYDQPIYE